MNTEHGKVSLGYGWYKCFQQVRYVFRLLASKTSGTCAMNYGSIQFSAMFYGVMNAAAMFQQIAFELLGDLDFVKIYIDDCFIYSNLINEHTTLITVVCRRIRWAGRKL